MVQIPQRIDETVDTLVSFAAGLSYNDLSPEAIRESKRRLIDSFAIAFAGYSEDPSVIARKMALESIAVPGATVLGTRHRSSPELATFANATMVHSQDYMDTYLSKESLHPSDTICAVLAAAESSGADGKTVILGVVLAYELMCRLADVANVRERGWDHVVFGAVSSSLASARVMNLTIEQMKETLALAAVANTALRQTRVGEVPMWKAFAPANAARNGLFAARLAKLGVTGPVLPFQGEKGFERQVSGPLNLTKFETKASGFMINRTYIKMWPVQYNTQAGIQAALKLRKAISDVDAIDKIVIDISDTGRILAADTAAKWNPETRETADHSLPYIVVCALLDGEVTRASFDREHFRNPRKLALVQKVEVRTDPEFTRQYPKSLSVRVGVRMQGGAEFTKQVDIPKGHALDPLTDHEVEEKFRTLTRPRLSSSQVERGIEQLWRMESVSNISELMDIFSLEPT